MKVQYGHSGQTVVSQAFSTLIKQTEESYDNFKSSILQRTSRKPCSTWEKNIYI